MRRLVLIVAALVVVPIVEIAILIAVGKVIGLGWTLLLMLGTSTLGGWLLRHEGTRAWRAFRTDLEANRPPGDSATDGLLVLAGGIFMLVPGFASDVIGLLLIAPPSRAVARRYAQHAIAGRLRPDVANGLFGPRRVRVRTATPRRDPPADPGQAGHATPIEGEIIDPR